MLIAMMMMMMVMMIYDSDFAAEVTWVACLVFLTLSQAVWTMPVTPSWSMVPKGLLRCTPLDRYFS